MSLTKINISPDVFSSAAQAVTHAEIMTWERTLILSDVSRFDISSHLIQIFHLLPSEADVQIMWCQIFSRECSSNLKIVAHLCLQYCFFPHGS